MAEDPTEAILDLLENEREAIMTGGFDRLERLAHRKQSLFDALVELPGEPAALTRIAGAVDRNQRLLAAAIEGTRDARTRLDLLRTVRQGFDTYDSHGRISKVAPNRPAVERKA